MRFFKQIFKIDIANLCLRNLCKLIASKEEITAKNISDYSEGLILVLPCISNTIIKDYVSFNNPNLSKIIFALQKSFVQYK